MQLVVVNFHYVGNRTFPHPGIHPLTPEGFRAQLRALGQGCEFVSLTDLLGAVEGRGGLPQTACLVTLDDGLREHYETAWAILREEGIPAAFFVNTRPVTDGIVCQVHKIQWLRAHMPPAEFLADVQRGARARGVDPAALEPPEDLANAQYRYDTPAGAAVKYVLNFVLDRQVGDAILTAMFQRTFGDERTFANRLYMTSGMWAELGAAGCLGTHGHAHLPLATLGYAHAREDLARSIAAIREAAGVTVRAASYPFGGPSAVSIDVERAAGDSGCVVGFTMERAVNRTIERPLLLARADTNDAPGGKSPCFEVRNARIEVAAGLAPSRRVYHEEHVT